MKKVKINSIIISVVFLAFISYGGVRPSSVYSHKDSHVSVNFQDIHSSVEIEVNRVSYKILTVEEFSFFNVRNFEDRFINNYPAKFLNHSIFPRAPSI